MRVYWSKLYYQRTDYLAVSEIISSGLEPADLCIYLNVGFDMTSRSRRKCDFNVCMLCSNFLLLNRNDLHYWWYPNYWRPHYERLLLIMHKNINSYAQEVAGFQIMSIRVNHDKIRRVSHFCGLFALL